MRLIGVDVGGTFTDLVLTDTSSNETLIHKVASTPDDLSEGVLRAVDEVCARAGLVVADIDHIFHGTTVATNAVLQHRGNRAGMVTSQGFRDIIHIGRHQRPQHYSIAQAIPWQERPLVRRRHRLTVSERLAPPLGEVVTPLAEAEVRSAARQLREAGVEAVAICFLFAYLNPDHERRTRAIVEAEFPEAFVTCSHEVSPQFREFERFTTTAMNAFIGPLVRDYVGRIADGLAAAGFAGEVHIMRSNGGVASPSTVARLPVCTLMSGLAAGVLGGAWVGRLSNRSKVITLDIGGTSADIGVVTDGRLNESSARDTAIAHYPVLVPMIDLHTIGAGGGSIAAVDEAGAFKVGPESAGAKPGPAAYGQGGKAATVTDANIVLGRLDAEHFLGGAMRLDAAAAAAAVQSLADQLRLSLHEAAEGVIAVLNANMANAIRVRTVQKGIDPRQYALVASGGAGPLHGAEVARQLGLSEVVVPPHPGINSALGLLTTDLKYEVVRSAFLTANGLDLERLNRQLQAMETELRTQLAAEAVSAAPGTTRFERAADARYVGQGYELRLPLPLGLIGADGLAAALAEFHQLHEQEYGHHFAQAAIELVNLRVSAAAEAPRIGAPQASAGGTLAEAKVRSAPVLFRQGEELHWLDTAFYQRGLLPIGEAVPGPAIILQTDSTTVVPPDFTTRVERSGCMVLRMRS